VYVDDVMVMVKDHKAFLDKLINDHKYKLKGVGKPTYHLGGDFFIEKDGTLGWGAGTYCKKLIQEYEAIFGQKPKEYSSPLDTGDHTELASSEFIDQDLSVYDWCLAMGSKTWKIQYP
jgi:hypothetical protein